jgi:lipopolysaccharide export system protein LptA
VSSWQKRLRFAIALFVVVFAAVLVVSLRKGRTHVAPATVPQNLDPKAVVQTSGSGQFPASSEILKEGKVTFQIKFGNQRTYADGRSVFGGGVTVVLPDKGGRQITVASRDAEVTRPLGKEVGTAVFTGGVKLVTSDGITVTTATANYSDAEQMARIPGPLAFRRGRMSGTGVGGTYDQTRGVLWLLDQAKVDVTPDNKGNGAIHVTSTSAGMARLEHYMKFMGGAHLNGEGHVTQADDATAYLTPDDERVTRMELRGHSRITGKPGESGPQDMRARDIDMAYAEDGRTLQSAHMVEDAVVQLPGEKGKPGRRIAGKGIDIALAPDGATVTNLVANEGVQVDLPADGDTPARRIRSASLLATGAPEAGIQAATFNGEVEYRENRAAKGKVAAVDRTAKSQRMDIKTKPGFGDLEQADFHNNVHFTDGATTVADAPTAVYAIAQDRLDLSPGPGDTGKNPHLTDGKINVDARNIQMTLGTQMMKADTNVRTVMIPESSKPAPKPATPAPAPQPQGGGGRAAGAAGQPPARGASPQGAATAAGSQAPAKTRDADAVKVPSMLKQNEPVYVKSNRLDYDGANSLATYNGNARLWQDNSETAIQADKIVLEDKTGNLHAATTVRTVMVLTEPDDKTTPAKPGGAKPAAPPKPAAEPLPTVTVADELQYEDAKHCAIYTGNAHMSGPSGDVTGDRIDLFLAEEGGQLERAEADGNVISRQVGRRAYGKHLTYLAKDDLYTMTGSPVKIYDQTPTNCRITEGATLTFHRAGNTTIASGNGTNNQTTKTVPVCPPEGSF